MLYSTGMAAIDDSLRCVTLAVGLLVLALPSALKPQTAPPAKTVKITVNAAFPPVTYLTFPGTHYFNDFAEFVLSSPYVDGVNPPLLWSMVDKGPNAAGGQYQWTQFDAAIQPYIARGKTVNLIVWPISEAGLNSLNYANHATPAYVMKTIDTVTCQAFPGDDTQTGAYPVVWSGNYKYHYKKFITAVLKHYEGNPHIGYVRFGVTGGATVYPNCETEQTKYLPPGETFRQMILAVSNEMLAYEKSQNSSIPVVGPFVAYDNNLNTADNEAAHGAANGFGLGYQGLRAADIATYPLCTSDWCHLFAQYFGPTLHMELQPVGQTDPSGTCTPSCWDGVQQQTGPLPPLLSFAVEHHANTFEIYALDLLVALDPYYPGFKQYHAAYRSALNAVHSGKGSALAISPDLVTFGEVPVGTKSAPQTITLTNAGPIPVKFNGVTPSGDYSETDDCAAQTLAPAQHCSISVIFTPSAIGKRTGIVNISDNDPWSPHMASLTGQGQ
jgi:hypothetical protein